jgi:hypothetical protein
MGRQLFLRTVALAAVAFVSSLVLAEAPKRNGTSCSTDAECASHRCDNAPGNPRACIPNDGQGQPGDYCTHPNQCGKGQICIATTSSSPTRSCRGNGAGQQGQPCTQWDQCVTSNCIDNKCVAAGLPGDRCSSNQGCGGLTGQCDTTVKPPRCVPPNGSGQQGQFCTQSNQCGLSNCINNKCVAAGLPGDRCSSNLGCGGLTGQCDTKVNPPRCVPPNGSGQQGQFCTQSNQCGLSNCIDDKCVAAGLPGDRCSSNQGCGGLTGRCDTTVSPPRCVPPNESGQPGQFCTQPNQCVVQNCIDHKCGVQATLGQPCSTNEGCLSRRCDGAQGNPHACIPNDGQGKPGDYCSHNNQCAPGHPCNLAPGPKPGRCQ